MATIDGAKVLGIDDKVGSLEVGKEQAPVIVIDLHKPPMAPVVRKPARNIVANLVYAETGSNVLMSMVAGNVIYQNGAFTNIDSVQVLADLAVKAKQFEEDIAGDKVVADLPITQLTSEGLI